MNIWITKRIEMVLSWWWLAVCMLLWCAAPTMAQPLPDAGSLMRQQEQHEHKSLHSSPEIVAPEVVRPAMKKTDGLQVQVNAIRFVGAVDLVSESDLQGLVHHAIGKRLDMDGLQQLADRVTKYLRDQGFLLARAYLPEQGVTAGTIEIAILKGRLDGVSGSPEGWNISLSEGARMDAARLVSIGESAMASGSTVRRGDLERALLLMNDLPGINAHARLAPGNSPDTTRVIVEAEEGPLLSANAWLNNYGNYSVGTAQGNALINLNDLLGIGEQVTLYASVSEGSTMGRVSYDAPIGVSGLRVQAGYSGMHYKTVNGTGVIAGLTGDSSDASAGFTYPIIRSRAVNLYSGLHYHYKLLRDDSSAGALRYRQVDLATLELSGDLIDALGGGGYNSWGLTMTRGQLDLGRVASDAAADAATLRTHGGFGTISFRQSRLQKMPGNFTLLEEASGQWASRNLNSSEQFVLGGPYAIRAYPVGEAQGDEGWLAKLALRYAVPYNSPLGRAIALKSLAAIGCKNGYFDNNRLNLVKTE